MSATHLFSSQGDDGTPSQPGLPGPPGPKVGMGTSARDPSTSSLGLAKPLTMAGSDVWYGRKARGPLTNSPGISSIVP